MADAKPCPHCACDEVSVQLDDYGDYVAMCVQCGSMGAPHFLKENALRSWNRRRYQPDEPPTGGWARRLDGC